MENTEKVYDMNRINTLLRYEKIPAYVMTEEQKAYLAGYRAQLESRKPVDVDKIEDITVRKPLADEIDEIEPKTQELDQKVADLVEEATKEVKETKKKASRKKKTAKTEEPEEVKE